MENDNKLKNISENVNRNVSTCILTSQELKDRIYQGESLPQDERFLQKERGGTFEFFDLQDFQSIFPSVQYYPVLELNNKILALAQLEEKYGDEKTLWIKFVSVDPQEQGKGYASKIIEEIFRFAHEHGYALETSSYSPQGMEKLKLKLNEYAKKYSVPFTDSDNIIFPHL